MYNYSSCVALNSCFRSINDVNLMLIFMLISVDCNLTDEREKHIGLLQNLSFTKMSSVQLSYSCHDHINTEETVCLTQ